MCIRDRVEAGEGGVRSGPVWAVGISLDEDALGVDRELTNINLGYRFVFEDPESWQGPLADWGLDLSFGVEPMVGIVLADDTDFEASVLPLVHIQPTGLRTWYPFLEGGIGVLYTSVDGFGLGSDFHFRDEVGVGMRYRAASGRAWSLSYRYRHISHADIFGDENDGLNTHFLVLAVE